MTNVKKSPANYAINIYKIWEKAGMGLPVNIELLALEFSKGLPDPIIKVVGESLPGIDGMLHKRKKMIGVFYIIIL